MCSMEQGAAYLSVYMVQAMHLLLGVACLYGALSHQTYPCVLLPSIVQVLQSGDHHLSIRGPWQFQVCNPGHHGGLCTAHPFVAQAAGVSSERVVHFLLEHTLRLRCSNCAAAEIPLCAL
jgi:hypothetical protein